MSFLGPGDSDQQGLVSEPATWVLDSGRGGSFVLPGFGECGESSN